MASKTPGETPRDNRKRPTKDFLHAEALDLIREHKSQKVAADFATREDGSGKGVHQGQFSRRLAAAMASHRAAQPVLTEEERVFHEHWGPEECIECLRDLQEKYPHQYITRTFYRNETEQTDSTWNRHFGTFLEFRRQAGLQFSRFAHRMELQIAKHASMDRMRVMNAEKAEWGESYLRPDAKRWQTLVGCADLHGKRCDPFYRRVLLDTIARVQPEKFVIAGDGLDLMDFSKFSKDPRQFELMDELHWFHTFLGDVREAAPGAEITFTEGNHEYRMLRHLAEQSPQFMVLLNQLHGFTVPKLLGLDRFEVNFIARADLSAFNERDIKKELRKNYQIFWRCLLAGHYPDMRTMGLPGFNGHHHRHELWSGYSPKYGPMEWHQVGCGHVREASYCPGETFANGFMICHVDTHRERTQFEYCDVSHEGAMVGGKFYQRTDEEPVLDLIE